MARLSWGVLVAVSMISGAWAQDKVIYGNDDRLDYYEVQDQSLKELSRSTVGFFFDNTITDLGKGVAQISAKKLSQSQKVCQNERFADQPVAAFCSGFFVGKDLIVSAGHCVSARTPCESIRFVFDYAMASPSSNPTVVKTSNVYACKKVIKSETISDGRDYSLIQLDREVKGRTPLKFRKTGFPSVGDELVIIGHPSGLPSKIADGAEIRDVRDEYLVANLDSYGGNSGSAVFNTLTHEVEGILVRGEQDYELSGSFGSCRISKRCDNFGCRGEDVTLISQVVPEIERHLQASKLKGAGRRGR